MGNNKVLDVSRYKTIKDAKHWYQELDQLYHPTGVFPQDSFKLVYGPNSLNGDTFNPIALKEWFYLLEKDGYLCIDYVPTKKLTYDQIEKQMWWLWRRKYDIIFHGSIFKKRNNNLTVSKINQFISDVQSVSKISNLSLLSSYPKLITAPIGKDELMRFVCKKNSSTKVIGDDIDKWTFGIITKGERSDWIKEIIKSIKDQKIPNYEIIICGTYLDKLEENVSYIQFNIRDDQGWITRKKNLICEKAKYENICMLHDRIVLNKDWYESIKEHGNTFEVLGCAQTDKNGNWAGDWLTTQDSLKDLCKISRLHYEDWDYYAYIGGQVTIIKKKILSQIPWDETRYWNGAEDIDLSVRCRDEGLISRINPQIKCTAFTWRRYGTLPYKNDLKYGIFPKDVPFRRLIRFILRLIFVVKPLRIVNDFLYERVSKTRLYRFYLNH